MGEKGAHLTISLQSKPSIFEVIAQESLADLIQPSCRRIVQLLVAKNPETLGWLISWFDEFYLIANTALQYNYLRSFGGSFSESFYGLQRLSFLSTSNKKFFKFRNKQEFLSLLSLVLIPYISAKLNQTIERCNEHDTLQGLAKYLVPLHKIVQGIWRGSTLVQYLLYMTGKSHTHSLLMRAIKVSLHYIPEQNTPALNLNEYLRNPKLYGQLMWIAIGRSLEVGVFFLQCLQWWQSEEQNRTIHKNIVPPPPKNESDMENSSICPVCKGLCQIETALSVSGYVFCYRCIYQALTDVKSCPVTGFPATIDDLIRLYPSS
uniref:Peroxisome assembly protein 12 n=1 Tax=Clastoptera arizonana TaxID=38151 RepID=A0A1B6C605_9HEMI